MAISFLRLKTPHIHPLFPTLSSAITYYSILESILQPVDRIGDGERTEHETLAKSIIIKSEVIET